MRQIKIRETITVRDKALEKYLQDISRQELLTVEQEVELARRARVEGDKAARDRLVKANLRFVVSVAKQYQNMGVPLLDLINEGNLGLMKAAQRFDETRGFKFISFAVWWIRQSILLALAEKSRIVRLPLNQVGNQNKINKIIAEFEQEHQRRPSTEEIAEVLGLPADKVVDTLTASNRQLSMDAPFSDDEGNCMLDVLSDDDDSNHTDAAMTRESLASEIDRALSQLQHREREVIKMSFGIGCREMSLDEIGEKFDLSRERVRQIRERALRQLRNSGSTLLRSYLCA